MKKGRLGFCLSVLCDSCRAEALEAVIFNETTAIGLRRFEVEKQALERTLAAFDYEGETLTLKRVSWQGKPLRYKVEYEDLVRFANEKNLGFLEAQTKLTQYLEAEEKWKNL